MSAATVGTQQRALERIAGKELADQLISGAADTGFWWAILQLGPSEQQIQEARELRQGVYEIYDTAGDPLLAAAGKLTMNGLLKQGGESKSLGVLLMRLSVFSLSVARYMEILHLSDAKRADLSLSWEFRGKEIGAAYPQEEQNQGWLSCFRTLLKKGSWVVACSIETHLRFLDIADAINFGAGEDNSDIVRDAQKLWLVNFANAYRIWQKFQVSGDAEVKSSDQTVWIDRCIAALGEFVTLTTKQVEAVKIQAMKGLAKMGGGTKSSSSTLKIGK